MNNNKRGFFGIGVQNLKNECNLGGIWRSAHNMGASFTFCIGKRYKKQKSDTTNHAKHIPFYEYETFAEFYDNIPKNCRLVGIEYPLAKAVPLGGFTHPDSCVYLLGAEDNGLSTEAIGKCHLATYIPSKYCLNVASAASIVLFHRMTQRGETY